MGSGGGESAADIVLCSLETYSNFASSIASARTLATMGKHSGLFCVYDMHCS